MCDNVLRFINNKCNDKRSHLVLEIQGPETRTLKKKTLQSLGMPLYNVKYNLDKHIAQHLVYIYIYKTQHRELISFFLHICHGKKRDREALQKRRDRERKPVHKTLLNHHPRLIALYASTSALRYVGTGLHSLYYNILSLCTTCIR